MSGCAVTYVSFYISVYFIYEIKYILHNNQFFAHTLWHSKHACTIDNKFKLQSENATKKKSSGSWITKCTLLSLKRESTESITHANISTIGYLCYMCWIVDVFWRDGSYVPSPYFIVRFFLGSFAVICYSIFQFRIPCAANTQFLPYASILWQRP